MNFKEQLKLKNVADGTRAIKKVVLPAVNSPGRQQVDQPELAAQRARDGNPGRTEFVIGLRVTTPGEQELIAVRANEYAAERKIDPAFRNERNPVYSLGYSLNLLAVTCVDPDGDPKNPRSFWGDTIDEAIDTIRHCEHMSRDSLLYLAEQQDSWQDAVSPQAKTLSPDQLFALMEEVATSPDASPFLDLRPGMQWQLLRFINGLYLNLLTASSPSVSSSSEEPSSRERGPETGTESAPTSAGSEPGEATE